jgi:hypothetical protein
MTVMLNVACIGLLCVPLLLARQTGATQAPAAPRIFAPGEISVGDFESHPAFADSGRTLYLLKSNLHFTWWTIVVSHLRSGSWSTPEVAAFSGRYSDADPFVSTDGSKFLFISNRPDGDGKAREDMDIWLMEREGDGWGTPKRLAAPINSPASEWFPVLTTTGMLYFGSSRPGGKGGTDIYRCVARLRVAPSVAPRTRQRPGRYLRSRRTDRAAIAPLPAERRGRICSRCPLIAWP